MLYWIIIICTESSFTFILTWFNNLSKFFLLLISKITRIFFKKKWDNCSFNSIKSHPRTIDFIWRILNSFYSFIEYIEYWYMLYWWHLNLRRKFLIEVYIFYVFFDQIISSKCTTSNKKFFCTIFEYLFSYATEIKCFFELASDLTIFNSELITEIIYWAIHCINNSCY